MEAIFGSLHLLGAIFIIGPMTIFPMTAMRAIRTGNAASAATLTKSANLFSWLSLIVALFGAALVSFVDPADNLRFGTPWLATSIALYAVALVLSLAVVVPALRRATAGIGTEGKKSYGLVAASSGIVALLLAAVIVLMVWRP
jgi:uncharacterized membrane protein